MDTIKIMRLILVLLIFVLMLFEVMTLPLGFLQLFSNSHSKKDTHHVKTRRNKSNGNQRYKDICQLHNIDSLMFPGALGNPICPY